MFQLRNPLPAAGPAKKPASKVVKPIPPKIIKPTAPKSHAVKENPNLPSGGKPQNPNSAKVISHAVKQNPVSSKPGMIKTPPPAAMPISKTPKPAPKPAAKPAPKPAAAKPVVKTAPTAPKPAPSKTPAPSTNKAPTPSTGKATPATPGKTVPATNPLNDLWNQANGYKTQLDALLKQGFTYDPNKDAAYLSLQATAQKNAKIASKGAMEDMNDRGILNSTVTSDRLGQIEQSAQDAVTAAIPGLSQNAYSHYMDQVNSLNGLWTSMIGQAQWKDTFNENHNQFQQNFNENKRQYDTTRTDNNSHWQQTYDHTVANDNAQLEISRANSDNSFDANTLANQKYQESLNSKDATNAAIGNILTFKNSKDAYNYIKKNVGTFYQNGVNFNDVLTGISKRFPDVTKKVKADKTLTFGGK